MIPIRYAPSVKGPGHKAPFADLYAPKNVRIADLPSRETETNIQWLGRAGLTHGGILLLGGATLEHFRLRVAQSQLRTDLLPSLWSTVGILPAGGDSFWSVPLGQDSVSLVPSYGGLRSCRLADYDDPKLFPNVALLRFKETIRPLVDVIDEFIDTKSIRTIVDLPELVVQWLAFVWGAGQAGNPLHQGHGLPSAVFVQAVCSVVDLDLSPGLASTSSCPESIWAAANFWEKFYQGEEWPKGSWCVRQPAAAVVVEHKMVKQTGWIVVEDAVSRASAPLKPVPTGGSAAAPATKARKASPTRRRATKSQRKGPPRRG